MKGRILDILQDAEGVVSGETLSGCLGITRVAVWKHIRGLQEMGYGIRSGPTGYRLHHRPDALYAYELPDRRDRIHYLPETPSTMDAARDLARSGCPDQTVVAAERQTAGRGRLQRTWCSEAGGIYATVVLRPEIPIVQTPLVGFAAAVAAAQALRELHRVDARVKWPNDILIGGRKICGILSEMETEGQRVRFVNIGIGINVANAPPAAEPNATALCQWVAAEELSRRRLFGRFLDHLAGWVHGGRLDRVVPAWKALNVTLGRRVRIATVNATLSGLARDVDSDGALILEQPDGSRQTIFFGDCFHIG